MKKRILIVISVLLAIILLIPIPCEVDDGGTVVYDAILYKVENVHAINPDIDSEQDFLEGLRIYFLGFEIFDNVK
jgi:hypothetical protein